MLLFFCHCAVDVLFQMESGGGEEPEKMSTDTGLELHPGGTETRASMLRSKCYISCSWTVQLSDFLIRWDQSHHKRPSPLDALLWATHKRLLITTQRSPCGALTFQHVWFPPFSRKSQQGCVPPAGVVGANGSRLRGIPSLWTLPRIWRYSGGPEWLLPTGHPAQIRAGRPPLSWCAFHIKTLSLFATRCWFRVSKTVF